MLNKKRLGRDVFMRGDELSRHVDVIHKDAEESLEEGNEGDPAVRVGKRNQQVTTE